MATASKVASISKKEKREGAGEVGEAAVAAKKKARIILQRIEEKAPYYNRKDWLTDRKRNIGYLSNIATFPYRYLDQMETVPAPTRPARLPAIRTAGSKNTAKNNVREHAPPSTLRGSNIPPRPASRGSPVISPLSEASIFDEDARAYYSETPPIGLPDAAVSPGPAPPTDSVDQPQATGAPFEEANYDLGGEGTAAARPIDMSIDLAELGIVEDDSIREGERVSGGVETESPKEREGFGSRPSSGWSGFGDAASEGGKTEESGEASSAQERATENSTPLAPADDMTDRGYADGFNNGDLDDINNPAKEVIADTAIPDFDEFDEHINSEKATSKRISTIDGTDAGHELDEDRVGNKPSPRANDQAPERSDNSTSSKQSPELSRSVSELDAARPQVQPLDEPQPIKVPDFEDFFDEDHTNVNEEHKKPSSQTELEKSAVDAKNEEYDHDFDDVAAEESETHTGMVTENLDGGDGTVESEEEVSINDLALPNNGGHVTAVEGTESLLESNSDENSNFPDNRASQVQDKLTESMGQEFSIPQSPSSVLVDSSDLTPNNGNADDMKAVMESPQQKQIVVGEAIKETTSEVREESNSDTSMVEETAPLDVGTAEPTAVDKILKVDDLSGEQTDGVEEITSREIPVDSPALNPRSGSRSSQRLADDQVNEDSRVATNSNVPSSRQMSASSTGALRGVRKSATQESRASSAAQTTGPASPRDASLARSQPPPLPPIERATADAPSMPASKSASRAASALTAGPLSRPRSSRVLIADLLDREHTSATAFAAAPPPPPLLRGSLPALVKTTSAPSSRPLSASLSALAAAAAAGNADNVTTTAMGLSSSRPPSTPGSGRPTSTSLAMGVVLPVNADGSPAAEADGLQMMEHISTPTASETNHVVPVPPSSRPRSPTSRHSLRLSLRSSAGKKAVDQHIALTSTGGQDADGEAASKERGKPMDEGRLAENLDYLVPAGVKVEGGNSTGAEIAEHIATEEDSVNDTDTNEVWHHAERFFLNVY
ncbi:hypothetical protein HK405_006171 [Cladochytrium tenue]|nr:hypothetical protein HK405_006171 [Cladochytrium tenue]